MNLETKKSAIIEHERKSAHLLAEEVICKPELSVWMILIPVVFIYYFWRLQKFSQSRREFVDQWMRQRSACIDEACRIAAGRKATPVRQMIPENQLPAAAVKPYTRWVECLTQHFTDLMKSEGDSLPELVKKSYRNRGNYLLFLNQLNEHEKALNEALLPGLKKETPGAEEVARQIEKGCRRLRRQEAEFFFN
jgi:hypothetical protein